MPLPLLRKSQPQATFFFLLILASLVALAIVFATEDDVEDKALFVATVITLCYFARTTLLTAEFYRSKIQIFAVTVAASATLAYFGVHGVLEPYIRYFLREALGADIQPSEGIPDLAIHGLVLVSVWLVTLAIIAVSRDNTAMTNHPARSLGQSESQEFSTQVKLLCGLLKDHLDRLDSESDWSHRLYVALRAEVEMIGESGSTGSVTELLKGIKKAKKTRLFVVVGDPGSGKSVALRKIARDLLAEVDSANRIPIYVNLKEWRASEDWSEKSPPTTGELREFILTNLKKRVPTPTANFLDTHFDKLHANGHLFLILDSFDEIPAILDSNEASWLIREVSAVVSQMIVGGTESRGIVASRHYRRVRISRSEYTQCNILPLSDKSIAKVIDQQAPKYAPAIKQSIFIERPTLGRIARNPFLLSLLIGYVERHSGLTPPSQFDLFDSFVSHSLQEAKSNLLDFGATPEEVMAVAEGVAFAMFATGATGLSLSLHEAEKLGLGPAVGDTLDFLARARIGRISDRSFSFVHRRFNEFFLIRTFLRRPKDAPLDSIPSDTRWRDAMVLYAEVAPPKEARRLARYCIKEMSSLLNFEATPSDAGYARALNCLRFMVEAFKATSNTIEKQIKPLERFVRFAIIYQGSHGDVLTAKHAVEAAGLLSEEDAQDVLADAISHSNGWVRMTAVRSTRYLQNASPEVQGEFKSFLLNQSEFSILFDWIDLKTSLSLSPALAPVRDFLSGLRWQYGISFGWALIVMILAPNFFGLAAIIGWILSRTLYSDSYVTSRENDMFRLQSFSRFAMGVLLYYLIAQAIAFAALTVGAFVGLSAGPTGELAFGKNFVSLLQSGLFTHIDGSGIGPLWLNLLILIGSILCWRNWMGDRRKIQGRLTAQSVGSMVEWKLVRDNAIGAFVVIAFIWSVPHAWRGLVYYLPALEPYGPVLLGVMGGILALGILAIPVAILWWALTPHRWPMYMWNRSLDLKAVQAAKKTMPTQRSEVAAVLSSLRTMKGRSAYADWLWQQREALKPAMRDRSNQWPEMTRPTYDDEPVTAILARLDERWWGLTR